LSERRSANGRRATLAAAALAAATAFLPFVRGSARGHCFYFRDLSRELFPIRRYVAEGLREGQVRWWDPYTYEGTPTVRAPVSYPVDWLHAFAPDERAFTVLLALHVPLAALAFFALARSFRLGRTAAAGGAIVYALGGVTLSLLSFYHYLQAAAWAPLIVLGLMRAATGGKRALVGGAAAVAMGLSTMGIEIVAQAVAVAAVCVPFSRPRPRSGIRLGASILLGLGLSSAALLPTWSQVAGSARDVGFPVSMVMDFSVHPVSLLQVLVGSLHGDLYRPMDAYWGDRFFEGGYPYLWSLYLGAAVLAVAVAGARHAGRWTAVLVALGLGAVLVSLGPATGMDRLAAASPLFRVFRYPCKAFFTVHLASALLAAFGFDALRAGDVAAWRWTGGSAAALGTMLTAAKLVGGSLGSSMSARLMPAPWPEPMRAAAMKIVLDDAAAGGAIALALAAAAFLVMARRLPARSGAWIAVAVVAADLLRTGAGLNPMVSRSFYEPSAEAATMAADVRSSQGRLFICEPELSPGFQRARAQVRGSVDVWTMAAYREALVPYAHLALGVPTAYSVDLTGMVPLVQVLPDADLACRDLDRLLPRLRAAGVSRVWSADILSHAELTLVREAAPTRAWPLSWRLYALRDPLPLQVVARSVRPAASRAEAEALASSPRFLAEGGTAVEAAVPPATGVTGRVVRAASAPGRVDITTEADQSTVVVWRESYASGWSARVNDVPTRVFRADGRHCAVPIPAGTSQVVLRYRPPHLDAALAVTTLCAMAGSVLWWSGRTMPTIRRP